MDKTNITELFNIYFECQKQFNCIGEKIFNHILENYPYIFNCHELKYSRARVTQNNLFLCYYDCSLNMLNPYFEFQIPIEIINNIDFSILEQWLQQKNAKEQNTFEIMEKIKKEEDYKKYLELKNKFESC